MEDGIYAVYEGKVYEYDRKPDGQYFLISRNKEDLTNEFVKEVESDDSYLIKYVNKDEMKLRFSIRTVCDYRGHRFDVLCKKDDNILIGTTSFEIYKSLKKDYIIMDEVNREEYELWVIIKDIILYKEKTIISDNKEKSNQKEIREADYDFAASLQTFKGIIQSNGDKFSDHIENISKSDSHLDESLEI